MNKKLHIRDATHDDQRLLAEGNSAMAWETEQKKLGDEVVLRGVHEVLLDVHKGRYLIAERKGERDDDDATVYGQLLLTTEWSDWRAQWFWWIQSVYVWPDARCQGVYRALYDEVKRQARDAKNVCGLRLYVDRDNVHAQKTYQRLGMAENDYHFFEWMLD